MRYASCHRLVILLALAVPAYAQSVVTAGVQVQDRPEIERLLSEIEQAFVSRDPEPFERIYIDGYVGIRGRPIYNAFDQLIAMIKWDASAARTGKKLDFETLTFENENPVVRVHGDVAVVTSSKKNLWRYKDSRCLNRYQSTDIFVKLESRWRLVLGHMSLIPCDPMPWQPPHPALADLRNQTRATKHLSPSVETEIREMLSKLNDAGFVGAAGGDAFATDFVFTGIENEVSAGRGDLLSALRTPTSRTSEKYRDDETFLAFGRSAAAYIFRLRSLPKGKESRPEPPVTFSVILSKTDEGWKIVSSHASTFTD